jgi:hypothetical protein
MTPDDWTEVAALGQAVGAIATSGAVVVALWVALRDNRVREKKSTERSKDLARQITLHTDLHPNEYPDYPISVKVQNNSDKLISKVDLVDIRHKTDDSELKLGWTESSKSQEGRRLHVEPGRHQNFFCYVVGQDGNRYWPPDGKKGFR